MELVRFGRNWSGLVELGRVWSGLVAFGRAWCLKWLIYGSFMSLWCFEGQLHPSLGPPHTHTHTTNDRSCSTVIDHDRPWSTVVGLDQPADHCWARPNIFAGDHERSPCKSVRVRPWSTMIDLTDYQIVWLWSTVIDHVIDLYRPCDRPWSTVIDHVIDRDRPWSTMIDWSIIVVQGRTSLREGTSRWCGLKLFTSISFGSIFRCSNSYFLSCILRKV